MTQRFVTVLYNDETTKFKKPKGNVKTCVKRRISYFVRRYRKYLRAILLYFDVILIRSFWGINFVIGRSPYDNVIQLRFHNSFISYNYPNLLRACGHSICRFTPRFSIYSFEYCGILFDPEHKILALTIILNAVFKIPLHQIHVHEGDQSIFVRII